MKAKNYLPLLPFQPSAWGKEHPFLADGDSHECRLLLDAAKRVHFDPGALILREGDPAEGLYLIQNGKVELLAHTAEGSSVPIQLLGAGDVLGWSWLFPPYFWHF